MRVLIPSDNRDFVRELAVGYRNARCDVVTGAFNFELTTADFDLVHYQWPEEFCGWVPPTDCRLEQIVERVKHWESRCPTIVSVHNLYPLGFHGDDQCRRLFNAFYQVCTSVLHFSSTSKNLVEAEFAGARHNRHIVTTPWNFEDTLQRQERRGECRAAFGFRADDFVVLFLGALRSWQEIRLVTQAYNMCRAPRKRLFMTGRYSVGDSRLRRRYRQSLWRFWLWRQGAVVDERFLPDEELYRYLDTADVVVVPRVEGLNSGIPSLAMTFGRVVIVPTVGAMPEQLGGTKNPIYEAGNPASLAKALEKAVDLDRQAIGECNRRLARNNSWERIVNDCLQTTERNRRTLTN